MTTTCFNTFNRSVYYGVDPMLPQQIDAVADAGFDFFGPDLYSLLAWEESGKPLDELAGRMKARGLGCGEIAAGLCINDPANVTADAEQAARVAEVLRPDWVQINVNVAPDDAACRAMERICDIIMPTGARVAIEYLSVMPVDSLSSTRLLVEAAGKDRAGIMVDSWHHFRGPDSMADLEALPLDLIAYLQFDDAPPMVGDDLLFEMMERRTFPGEGELDLTGFCDVLRRKGFNGMVSAEVLNREWRDQDIGVFAARAQAATRRFWPE